MDRQKLFIGLMLIALYIGGTYILVHNLLAASPGQIDVQKIWKALPMARRMIIAGLCFTGIYGIGMVLNEILMAGRRTGDRG